MWWVLELDGFGNILTLYICQLSHTYKMHYLAFVKLLFTVRVWTIDTKMQRIKY